MSQAVEYDLYLYTDDSCLLFRHKSVTEIKKQLTKDFSNICDWFVDNKLDIHFGKDKTKSVLFSSKRNLKLVEELDIRYKEIKIKQHKHVNYLGCAVDKAISGETMVLRVTAKINSKLKFLRRKNRFLDVPLRRLLCNALIQPLFDYTCTAWYPNLTKKLKDKLQVTQNKCIRFCLKLRCREHISNEHFKELNWLPIYQRFKQCVTSTIFKFVQNKCPAYMNEVSRLAENIRINTRNSYLKLSYPFRETSTEQNGLFYNGPAIWNRIPEISKTTKNLNTFQILLNDLSNPNL